MPPRLLIASALLATAIAGCAPAVVFVETPPAILVEPVHVEIGGRGRYMSFASRSGLRQSLIEISGGRIDALHLSIHGPKGWARAAAKAAHAAGVEASKIRLHPGSRLRVKATMYKAHPPGCPDLNVFGPPVGDNDFEPTIGCSDLSNLAAMVNDPRDLIGNSATRPADGERASLAVSRYRLGGAAVPYGSAGGGQAGRDRGSPPLSSTGGLGAASGAAGR